MKKTLHVLIITFVIIFSLTGCVEHRYYHDNDHHSNEYNHRHHHKTHADIDLNIHN